MGMTIAFCHNNTYAEAVEYTFVILSSSLDCNLVVKKEFTISSEMESVVVSYGPEIPSNIGQNHLHIFADLSFWENFGKPESFPKVPMYRIPLRQLELTPNEKLEDPLICPYLHRDNKSKPVYWTSSGPKDRRVLICEFDVLASAFFWLTRYEEAFNQGQDEFGCLPEHHLLSVRENCYSRPLVDEYVEVLRQLLNHFDCQLGDKREPFRVLITHDVDSGIPLRGGLEYFKNGLRSFCREVCRERRLRAGLINCFQWFAIGAGLRSYIDSFANILQIDNRYGYTSHFFLMANGTNPKDAKYNIESEQSQRLIQKISLAGGHIGLHLGLDSHKNHYQFNNEWSSLRAVFPDILPASRSHYLVFQVPDTWNKLSEVGCRVDTSLGFNECVGFRAGTSRPFRPFDVINHRILTIWEYPLTLMDINLFVLPVRSDRRRIDEAYRVIDKVAAQGGCLVINWHNAYFYSDYLSMYLAILNYVVTRGVDIRLADAPEPDHKLIW